MTLPMAGWKAMIWRPFRFSAYLFLLPIYWISCIIPKNKDLWVLGAWFGHKFADNSKYLFLYIKREHPEIRAVWLAREANVVNDLRGMGYEAYMAYSLKGSLISVRAGCIIISTSFNDVNRYIIGGAKKIILWHGTPLKKIVYDDEISLRWRKRQKNLIIDILLKLSPYPVADCDICISPSEEVSLKFASAFAKPKESIRLTGYPRNDAFFNVPWQADKDAFYSMKIRQTTRCQYLITYLPTHREAGLKDTEYLFSSYGFNADDLDRLLQRHNAAFVIKTHYYNQFDNAISEMSQRIFRPSDSQLPDIYPLLTATDILITDYSSVYFDYLLLGRPIIFAPFDLEDYVKRDRELYYDYDTVTPGPKAKNWPEVLDLIEKILIEDEWKERREKICRRFNEFRDGKSSSRVFEEIRKLLKS